MMVQEMLLTLESTVKELELTEKLQIHYMIKISLIHTTNKLMKIAKMK